MAREIALHSRWRRHGNRSTGWLDVDQLYAVYIQVKSAWLPPSSRGADADRAGARVRREKLEAVHGCQPERRLPDEQGRAAGERPIKLVVAFPAGGGADVVVRTLTPYMSEFLGKNIVVENRPGASGNIGTEYVLKQPADGCTMVRIDIEKWGRVIRAGNIKAD
ncbi:MAG: hypothetical protein EPO20_21185 [Betaproteobacteria bacterium]|nr:MAG: hypothetical protein EPO20_21185 [Betaproteobacteria bacterium]